MEEPTEWSVMGESSGNFRATWSIKGHLCGAVQINGLTELNGPFPHPPLSADSLQEKKLIVSADSPAE